jgi:hypothetical protein
MAECKRFRTEDIPPRLDTKQKLLRIYDEIQASYEDSLLI